MLSGPIPESEKIKLKAELISALKDDKKASVINALDPFDLLKPLKKQEQPKDFQALVLSKHNLSGPNEIKLGDKEADDIIPKRIHFIWLGGVLPESKKEAIEKCRALNPDYTICIWIDHDTTEIADFDKYKKWAQSKGVHLIDSEALFAGHMGLEQEFKLELFRPNYGAASDILRLYILRDYFGIYFDTDILCKESLGTITTKKGHLINRQAITTQDKDLPPGFNNDVIMVTSKNILIKEWIALLENNYKKKYHELIESITSIYSKYAIGYLDEYLNIFDDLEIMRQLTINQSGPGVMNALTKSLEKHAISKLDDDLGDIRKKIDHAGELSWLEKNVLQVKGKSQIDILKKILTTLLNELEREPRILMLNKNEQYAIHSEIILEILAEQFPDKLKNVKCIHIAPEATTEKTLALIKNASIFPVLAKHFTLENFLPILVRYPNVALFNAVYETSKAEITSLAFDKETAMIILAAFNAEPEKLNLIKRLNETAILSNENIQKILLLAVKERNHALVKAMLKEFSTILTYDTLKSVMEINAYKYDKSEKELAERIDIINTIAAIPKFEYKESQTLIHENSKSYSPTHGHSTAMLRFLHREFKIDIHKKDHYDRTAFDIFLSNYINHYNTLPQNSKKSYQESMGYFIEQKATYDTDELIKTIYFELKNNNHLSDHHRQLLNELIEKLHLDITAIALNAEYGLLKLSIDDTNIELTEYLIKKNVPLEMVEYLDNKIKYYENLISQSSEQERPLTFWSPLKISLNNVDADHFDDEEDVEKLKNKLNDLQKIKLLMNENLKVKNSLSK